MLNLVEKSLKMVTQSPKMVNHGWVCHDPVAGSFFFFFGSSEVGGGSGVCLAEPGGQCGLVKVD
jgi:hypothetical protein